MNPPTSQPPPAVRPIIVVPTCTPYSSLDEARAAGYVPVLCDTPEAVRVIMPAEHLASPDLCMAALHAVVNAELTHPEPKP